jgi:hypothetical protein
MGLFEVPGTRLRQFRSRSAELSTLFLTVSEPPLNVKQHYYFGLSLAIGNINASARPARTSPSI